MIRVVLPVVIETEETDLNDIIGKENDQFQWVDMTFYEISSVEPHAKYTNLCHIVSGGAIYVIALSTKECDERISMAMKLNIFSN